MLSRLTSASVPALTNRSTGATLSSRVGSSSTHCSTCRHVPAGEQTCVVSHPVQSDMQPLETLGSQTSPAAVFTTPSPQAGAVQSESHVALFTPFDSQVSPALRFTIPSPHVEIVHFAVHAAVSMPASHVSPVSTI